MTFRSSRRWPLLALCCLLAASCDYRGPLYPSSPAPEPVVLLSMTATTNRTHVPYPVGPVTLIVEVTGTGELAGVPVDVVMRLDDTLVDMLSQIRLDASGRAAAVYSFAGPGTITAKLAGFSKTIAITQERP